MADGDLTTPAAVRAYLKGQVPVPLDDEPLIEALVTAASQLFVSETSREILTGPRTDTHSGDGGTKLFLNHYPVVSVETVLVDDVQVDERPAVGEAGWVLSDPASGKLEMVGSTFSPGAANVVVEYTSGYGASAPADVAQAVLDQAAYMYRQKDRIGIANESTQAGGSVGYLGAWTAQQGKGGQTPLFAATVARYRRIG